MKKIFLTAVFCVFLTGVCFAGITEEENEFAMPAREKHLSIGREITALSSVKAEDRADNHAEHLHELYRQRLALASEMRAEIDRINNLIYIRRQEELKKRAHLPILKGKEMNFTAENYPRIDGSTSAHPLAMLIACRLIDVPYSWTMRHRPSLKIEASPENYFTQYYLTASDTPPEIAGKAAAVNRLVVHRGTHGAYMNLINNKADFILTARAPSADELKRAEALGVELETVRVASDALVFIVSRDNPVKNLSTEKLKGIYTGKIKNWEEAGGRAAAINAYQRQRNSGSQELMLDVFMKETALPEPGVMPSRQKETAAPAPGVMRFRQLITYSMMGPFHALMNDPDGVGYSVYYYEYFMSASPYTRLLKVDGVLPSYSTIKDGSYLYATGVYAVIRKDSPEDSAERRLLNWLISEEGQNVIEESGYVPFLHSSEKQDLSARQERKENE